jgi:hypothetical protein
LAESWKLDELEDRPMDTVSPFSGSSTVGTAERGARSEAERTRAGRCRSGELDMMPVLEVGTGVGYLVDPPLPVFWRLRGRGKPGDDERGSNGGSRDAAGRLLPVVGALGRDLDGEEKMGMGSEGSSDACFGLGRESMVKTRWRVGRQSTTPPGGEYRKRRGGLVSDTFEVSSRVEYLEKGGKGSVRCGAWPKVETVCTATYTAKRRLWCKTNGLLLSLCQWSAK